MEPIVGKSDNLELLKAQIRDALKENISLRCTLLQKMVLFIENTAEWGDIFCEVFKLTLQRLNDCEQVKNHQAEEIQKYKSMSSKYLDDLYAQQKRLLSEATGLKNEVKISIMRVQNLRALVQAMLNFDTQKSNSLCCPLCQDKFQKPKDLKIHAMDKHLI